MFLKFGWSIGLSFSLFILLFLFAFQGGLEAPSIKPSPTVTNYMSFSPKPRALEEGFDAGLGPRHSLSEAEICGCSKKEGPEGGKDS